MILYDIKYGLETSLIQELHMVKIIFNDIHVFVSRIFQMLPKVWSCSRLNTHKNESSFVPDRTHLHKYHKISIFLKFFGCDIFIFLIYYSRVGRWLSQYNACLTHMRI